MRVSAYSNPEEARPRPVPRGLGPPPNLDRFKEQTEEVVRAVVGVNPQQVLDLYLAAQQKAGKIREEIAEVSSLLVSLRARYWTISTNPSHFDIQRKILLKQLSEEIRQEEGKMSDARADAKAHAHPDYIDFIQREEKGRLEMEFLLQKQAALQDKLETALGVVEYYAKAHQSCQSMIWFAREENKHTY